MARHKAPSQRQLKAGELVRRALVDIINREHLRDPDLDGISVTISEVLTSPDLKHAIVYAAPLGGGDNVKMVAALNRCARFLRGRLGHYMEMKSTPALKFVADTSFDAATDMNKLFNRPDVKRDLD